MTTFIAADDIRDQFAQAMSVMYQQDVAQYSALRELVSDVNFRVLEKDARLHQDLVNADQLGRLKIECSGAIRVGRPDELAILCAIFAVMGMAPVGYYDLTPAGLPIHATAFRTTSDAALNRNPLRVFTSLLRLDLIAAPRLRKKAAAILARRAIFTPGCRQALALHARQGGLTESQATEFIAQVLHTLRWNPHTCVDKATYQALAAGHELLADVVSFAGCHLNHLTPGTLDIDRVQALMPEYGLLPEKTIVGPPRRQYPILLRQTRFQSPAESVEFSDGATGMHRARLGEVEQRGVALTPKGWALYHRLLAQVPVEQDALSHQQALFQAFQAFPDDDVVMRRLGLAYYRYRLTPVGEAHRHAISPGDDPQSVLERGWITAQPIWYEDFLPVSAATATLAQIPWTEACRQESKAAFEQALGREVLDPFVLYAQAEARSKRRCGLL